MTYITKREEEIGKILVDIAFRIHTKLGPVLLETVYEKVFVSELERLSIPYEKQKSVPIWFNGKKIDDGLRLDLLVDDLVIVEIKAQDLFHPVWEAQLLSYLKLTGLGLGYLINFHVPLIKNGIKRRVL